MKNYNTRMSWILSTVFILSLYTSLYAVWVDAWVWAVILGAIWALTFVEGAFFIDHLVKESRVKDK